MKKWGVLFLLLLAVWHEHSTSQLQSVQKPIKIGVLHSLTGTMASSEKPLVNAIKLAVEELNAKGGLLGRSLELIVTDTASEPDVAAMQAEQLISQAKVDVLFGCWTSSCRVAVKPIVEKHKHLLFYPVQYEGLEESQNIIYTGAAPNQQIIPGTHWALEKFGQHVYLIGSDYIFPRIANLIIHDLIFANHGQILGERYLPLGDKKVQDVIADLKNLKPDLIINTLNGDSNQAFFQALVENQLADIPVLSFSVGENEIIEWQGEKLTQHYAVWNYFQSLDTSKNTEFMKNYQQHFGENAPTSDPIEAAYNGVYLWAQAVKESHSAKPASVNQTILRQSINAPSGIISVDAYSRHLWKKVHIGKVNARGQFDILYSSENALRPMPYPSYRSKIEWQQLKAQTLLEK